ncbi:N-acetyltransferase [Streptomyces sp. G-G2]|uniref:GNAT family N-acetyltransferase n=1 Tax=Streptomyces sp. G-G2 TaxID=3046201 RepID=UPI0024BBC506|nr:N-acetyltransferase [Streptomyces sp. G-G2]MDJ0382780.1 N-acetyltransferase [Streptomyces sp. G-G2]
MAIDIRDLRAAGRLEAHDGADLVGGIAYFVLSAGPSAGALVAVHTVVEPGHEGRGIAGDLVRAFYAIAAAEKVAVVALCPYAASWAARHPDEAPQPPAEAVEAAKRQLDTDPDLW